jgi:hypothetical protein
VLASHARYARFLGYGEAANYAAKLEKFRVALGEKTPEKPPKSP